MPFAHSPRLSRLALLFTGLLAAAPLLARADSYRIVANIEGSVTALSANGQAAAGMTLDNFETFRWTARGGLVRLGRSTWDTLGHMSGTPRISANGQVVSATILSDDGTFSTAGRWTPSTGWSTLAPLPANGGVVDGETSSAFGLSGDGQVVTGLFWLASGSGAHAMRWSAASGMGDLGAQGRSSRADGASQDGRVLAGWDEHPSYGNRRATVWVQGVRTVLEDSDWPSEASAVTPDGGTVVGLSGNPSDFQTYATRWHWNGSAWDKTLLGVINKRGATGYAFATGISADGSVVVGGNRPDGMSPKQIGFIWTASGGFQDVSEVLKAAGVRLNPLQPVIGVGAISADGSTLAVVTQGLAAPWPTRTLIVRRAASALQR